MLLLVSGVDATLGHLSHTCAQSSLTVYDDRGIAVLACTGDINDCKTLGKAGAAVLPTMRFLHRT
jgi:hypothetical protein